jgi:DNA-binding ferritin-like protein (Dps family)
MNEASQVDVKIEKIIWEVRHSEIHSENIRSQIRELLDGDELDGEIVLDITGGTKSMSISAYQVAELEGYTAAYRVQGDDSRYEIYGSAGR